MKLPFFGSRHRAAVPRERILLLVTLSVLVLAVLAAVGYGAQKYLQAQARIAELTPRYQRLEGSWLAREDMQTAQQAASQLLDAYAYPASMDTGTLGTDIQQKIRNLFAGAGVDLASSQVMPEREDGNLLLVPVTVRASGSIDGIRNVLAQLAAQTPYIRLESLNLQQGRKLNLHTPVTINMQATLVVWRRAV